MEQQHCSDSTSKLLERDRDAANLLIKFLAKRDIPEITSTPADLLVVCGSSVLATVYVAVQALQHGTAPAILITGGVGHSTEHLYESIRHHPIWGHTISTAEGRNEADVLRDLCIALGVKEEQLLPSEIESRNCGGNAEFSKKMTDKMGLKPSRVIMIQDPTMQLRTHASFTKWWAQEPPIDIISYSPLQPLLQLSADGQHLQFVPESVSLPIPLSHQQPQAWISSQQSQQQQQQHLDAAAAPSGCEANLSQQQGIWNVERYISLLLGEIPRLRDAPGGYGPGGSGFIDHVDVPGEAEEAYSWLAGRYPDLVRG